MDHRETVKNKIAGDTTVKRRREELWEKVAEAYEQGGGDSIKSILFGEADGICTEFDGLLRELRKKL
jgi:hypothetical protein